MRGGVRYLLPPPTATARRSATPPTPDGDAPHLRKLASLLIGIVGLQLDVAESAVKPWRWACWK